MFRDGPLTRRPPETIRYGTGRCALGALLVACSEKGIVTNWKQGTPRLVWQQSLGVGYGTAAISRGR